MSDGFVFPKLMRFQSRSWKKYKVIFVKTSMPPIDKASVDFPVIMYEMTMVSIVPMVRHEIDFAILLYDFSFIKFHLKKSPSGIQKGLVCLLFSHNFYITTSFLIAEPIHIYMLQFIFILCILMRFI